MSAARTASGPTDPAAPGLAFLGVSAGYAGHAVVEGVDLEVARGELVGLVGPNGAGKSTLLRSITGAAEVLAGSVRVAGLDARSLDARARARIVAVVPQSPPTLFAFTAREFVAMGRHPHLGPLESLSATDDLAIDLAMGRTDTARLADERVDTLSGGDLQRLTLAQALAQGPELLLLDEPTSHLDLNHRLQVLDLVRELADGGLAVLGVFHDLDLAARYSDRLAVVADGGILRQGRPAEVITPELVREVFSVRAVVGTDAVTGAVAITPVVREQGRPTPTRGSVFVVGGSGEAAPLLRRLALAGFEVRSGALNRGDVDQAVAEALGADYVELPPFGEIAGAEQARIDRLAATADVRLVCEVPFGRANLGNLAAAVAAGPPLVLVGALGADRDFTGGEAVRLAREASARGAVVVADADAALGAVETALADREA